eukprot:SAG31_NODE_7557_length_1655_cov_1.075835_2_plen_104_part_00
MSACKLGLQLPDGVLILLEVSLKFEFGTAQAYYLAVRSHPAAEASVVWGWREPIGAPLKCSTAAVRTDAPHGARLGAAAHLLSKISVTSGGRDSQIRDTNLPL